MITFNFDGTSHGVGYTGTICGIPQGVCVNINNINSALATRKSGFGRSARQNFVDKVVFVGHEQEIEFVTNGNDITFFVANTSVETRPNITAVRTGHADLVGTIRHPNLTARDIAEIASAVLKSSSIAASYFFINPAASSKEATSFSVTASPVSFACKSLNFSAAVTILSKPFFAASIKSAEKFNGLL